MHHLFVRDIDGVNAPIGTDDEVGRRVKRGNDRHGIYRLRVLDAVASDNQTNHNYTQDGNSPTDNPRGVLAEYVCSFLTMFYRVNMCFFVKGNQVPNSN